MINYTRHKYATDFLFEGRHIESNYAIERHKCSRFVSVIPPKDIFSEERKYLNAAIDPDAYRRRCGLLMSGSLKGWKPTDMFT